MRVTIIREDQLVQKGDVSYNDFDLSSVPSNVHALQWNGEKGWIEFVSDADFNKPANEVIETLPQWALDAVAMWDTEHAVRAAQLEAQLATINQAQPTSQGAQTL